MTNPPSPPPGTPYNFCAAAFICAFLANLSGRLVRYDESIVVANELVKEETTAAVEVDVEEDDDGVVIPGAEDLAP